MGVSRRMVKLKTGYTAKATSSGRSLAMLLGAISPNISTTTVITAVDTDTPCPPIRFTNSTVASEADSMFTMLLPTSMPDSSLS